MTVKRFFVISLVSFGAILALAVVLTPLLQKFYPLPPDTGASFYQWQLADPATAARISFWGGYILHQIAVWILLFRRRKIRPEKGKVGKLNVLIFAVNIFFVGVHLLQTHIWYDGLAQDVPIWTSQGSVIVMLVFILFMMIPVRGLFFGKKWKQPQRMDKLVKIIHGPFISWALVYTFWFHPMDLNWGLFTGFIYMFLLFIQLSLFDTPLHFNRGWIVLLETFVAVHGTLITVYKNNEIWPMFLFGFLVIFFVTQLHTFRLPKAVRAAATILFVIVMVLVYVFVRGMNHFYEITFIPVALYGGAIGIYLTGLLVEKISVRQKTI